MVSKGTPIFQNQRLSMDFSSKFEVNKTLDNQFDYQLFGP
jgi:hypothetical protein